MAQFTPDTVCKLLIVCVVFSLYFFPILHNRIDILVKQGPILFSYEVKQNIFNDPKYLVETSKCKILDVDPFHPEIRKFYHAYDSVSCSTKPLLTYVTKVDNTATLHVNSQVISKYTKNNISCCYSNITRKTDHNNPDNKIEISSCVEFESNATFLSFVMVKCKDKKTKKDIYENTHAAVTVNEAVKKKMDDFDNNTMLPFSVLFVGIDSISRLNLLRTLPATYQFLVNNEWVNLKGYNKVGDNTFPNLMAILAGFNNTYARSTCDPTKLNKLDHCPLIWYDFRKLNYITGYAEDKSSIGTFNYMKKGFTEAPTDYYFRPYIKAFEKKLKKKGMFLCSGPESTGERIMNVAKDFVLTFRDYPTFSFFWMNSFSHEWLNSPSRMDNKIKYFLETMSTSGVLNNTFVIFLSDHGMRFGEARYTYPGSLEDRLPFIYISVPERFKIQFPTEYKNLLDKRHQLTNPYDLHMTLQHILVLSEFNYTMHPSNACPKCKSFFMETQPDRSCEDAAIEQHWCTCAGYNAVGQNDRRVKNASTYIIEQIQGIVNNNNKGSKCAKYSVNQIMASSVSEAFTYKNDIYFRLVIETIPKAVFEATLSYNNHTKEEFQLQGEISRLDIYEYHSACTKDAYLKKYCYCQ